MTIGGGDNACIARRRRKARKSRKPKANREDGNPEKATMGTKDES